MRPPSPRLLSRREHLPRHRRDPNTAAAPNTTAASDSTNLHRRHGRRRHDNTRARPRRYRPPHLDATGLLEHRSRQPRQPALAADVGSQHAGGGGGLRSAICCVSRCAACCVACSLLCCTLVSRCVSRRWLPISLARCMFHARVSQCISHGCPSACPSAFHTCISRHVHSVKHALL